MRWVARSVVVLAVSASGLLPLPAHARTPAPDAAAPPAEAPLRVGASAAPAPLFDSPYVFEVNTTGSHVATGDLDGDGDQDVVSRSANALVVYRQRPDGRIDAATPMPPLCSSSVHTGDLDGDGRDDVVCTTGDGSIAVVALGDTAQDVEVIYTPARTVEVAVGDLDGDGRQDILASTTYGAYAALQGADGTLGQPKLVAGTANAVDLHLVHLDGDGRIDLVYRLADRAWFVRKQNAAGSFTPQIAVDAGAATYTSPIVAADLNDDGRPDLALVSTFSSGPGLRIRYQAADGSFEPVVVLPPPAGSVVDLAVGDVTGDGLPDLVGLTIWGQSVVYPQGPAGLGPLRMEPGIRGEKLALRDVNGDGMADVVTPDGVAYGAVRNAGPFAQNREVVAYQPGPAALGTAVTDLDDTDLQIVYDELPAHGTVSGVPPVLTYQPVGGYAGPDAVSYWITDGKRKWTPRVTLSIDVLLYGTVQGTVTDGYQTVLAGIRVTLFDVSSGSETAVATTTTDADGTYHFAGVTVGYHALRFEDPMSRYTGEWWPNQHLGPLFTATSAFELSSGGSFTGDMALAPRGFGPWYVTSIDEHGPGSLREAVAWARASPGGDIVLMPPAATIVLTCAGGGQLRSTSGPLEIIGNGSTIRQTCPGQRVIEQTSSAGGYYALHLVDLRIEGGSSSSCGGGVASASQLVLERTLITGNSSSGGGGGVCGLESGSVVLVRSTVAGNTTDGDGGGIHAGSVTVTDSTVVDNHASGAGGGIHAGDHQPVVKLTHATVVGNGAEGGAANIDIAGSLWSGASVIGDAVGGGPNCSPGVMTTSQGYSFSDDASCLLAGTGDISDGPDPGLGPLALQGGATPTRVPGAASPLVGAIPLGHALCAGIDQRGATRPGGAGCEIGAVERDGIVPPAPPGQPSAVTATPGGLAATVRWSAPDPTAPITGYLVTAFSFDDSDAPSHTCAWSSGPLQCTVTGLRAGADYQFSVHASGPGGPGPESLLSGPVTVAGAAAVFHPVVPDRVVDTRAGGGPVSAGSPRSVSLAWSGGWPTPAPVPEGATAVILNVAVTNATAGSYLRIGPTGKVVDTASLNFAAGQTVANLVTVPLGDQGAVTFLNAVGSVHVVADLVGFFTPAAEVAAGSRYNPLPPARLLDSRTANGGWSAPLQNGEDHVRTLPVTGRGGVPPTADAVVMNVTVTAGTTGSYLQLWPTGDARPTSANLNFAAGETRSNLVVMRLGAGGAVSLFNAEGSVHVVADVVGYFDPGGGDYFHTITPTRLLDSRFGIGSTGPWGAGATRSVLFAGTPQVSDDATSVALNVAATDATTGSFITLFPAGTTRPTAAAMTFGPGAVVSNASYAKTGTTGQVAIYNHLGSVHLVADATGYFSPG